MRFMILIGGNQEGWDNLGREGRSRLDAAHDALVAELSATGELGEVNQLGVQRTDARTLRAGEHGLTVTDGPFIESKEIVAGYYLIDVTSIDRATEIAGRLVETEFAPVEVRVIHEEPVDF